MGTGAFNAAQLDNRSVDIGVSTDQNALIGLIPGDDELVYQNSNGKLEIDFTSDNSGDGINPDSTYQVGAIGQTGADAISTYVDNTKLDPEVSTGDIIYGDAVDNGEPTADTDPAFSIRNQSDNNYNIELYYNGDGVSGVTVLLAGHGPTNDGAAAFAIDPANDDGSGRLGGFPLKAGNKFDISMLIVADEDAATNDSFNNNLVVQAAQEEGDY